MIFPRHTAKLDVIGLLQHIGHLIACGEMPELEPATAIELREAYNRILAAGDYLPADAYRVFIYLVEPSLVEPSYGRL